MEQVDGHSDFTFQHILQHAAADKGCSCCTNTHVDRYHVKFPNISAIQSSVTTREAVMAIMSKQTANYWPCKRKIPHIAALSSCSAYVDTMITACLWQCGRHPCFPALMQMVSLISQHARQTDSVMTAQKRAARTVCPRVQVPGVITALENASMAVWKTSWGYIATQVSLTQSYSKLLTVRHYTRAVQSGRWNKQTTVGGEWPWTFTESL